MPIYLLVLNFLQILARLILGVQSFRYARGKKMKDFYWLAGHFFFFALVDISINLYNGLGLGPVLSVVLKNPYRIFFLAGDICLVMFVVKTFYQNRKSLFPLFLGISIIWGTTAAALYCFYDVPPGCQRSYGRRLGEGSLSNGCRGQYIDVLSIRRNAYKHFPYW
jgi:hypothetical protein